MNILPLNTKGKTHPALVVGPPIVRHLDGLDEGRLAAVTVVVLTDDVVEVDDETVVVDEEGDDVDKS